MDGIIAILSRYPATIHEAVFGYFWYYRAVSFIRKFAESFNLLWIETFGLKDLLDLADLDVSE